MKFFASSEGFEEVLLSLQPQMNELARSIAGDVEAQLPADGREDVVAEAYDFKPRGRTSARAAASVAVRRPDARRRQARDGLLTRSAGRQGLEVRVKADG